MSDTGASHWRDATDDGKLRPGAFVRKLREGCVVTARTPAGTYTMRRNPRSERYGRREFTVHHCGRGGGFTARFGSDAGTVKSFLERAEGERALKTGGLDDWPDGHDAVPEAKWRER